ncbi:MAG: metal ABC transporter substrate-binding protein [Halobacteriales archaeon]
MHLSRRRLVGAIAGAAAGATVAGCLGDGRDGPDGFGAFFTLADWAQAVAGDHLAFESPVPLGRVGHGWEPGVEVSTDIADADVFVYPDLPSFRWAQTAADNLATDSPTATLIDVLADVDLLPLEDDHDDADEHGDSAGLDPHAWTDPVRAQAMVETIVDGLAEAYPDTASDFEANAAAYIDRLAGVHADFEAATAEATHDVCVLAGHNSFRYLAHRYGFEIVTPSGVSPDSSPAPGVIADVVDLIDDRDIDVVLTDAFESDDLAETIVENSTATEVREVSPAEGTTADWRDEGWGYIEQMEAVNLPAFEAALGTP